MFSTVALCCHTALAIFFCAFLVLVQYVPIFSPLCQRFVPCRSCLDACILPQVFCSFFVPFCSFPQRQAAALHAQKQVVRCYVFVCVNLCSFACVAQCSESMSLFFASSVLAVAFSSVVLPAGWRLGLCFQRSVVQGLNDVAIVAVATASDRARGAHRQKTPGQQRSLCKKPCFLCDSSTTAQALGVCDVKGQRRSFCKQLGVGRMSWHRLPEHVA